MQSSTGLGAARSTGLACCPRLLRPVCAHLKPRAVFQSFSATSALRQSTSSRRQRLCTITAAQDQPDREPSVDNGQIQSPTGSDLRPQVSESKISADVKEEPKLGLAGSIVMWGFLVFLFAGSLFFTFSRSFLPDMQPLDTSTSELRS